MSLKFLMVLADCSLPHRVTDPGQVIHVDTLVAAKLIDADLPDILLGQLHGEAVVRCITPLGLTLVASMRNSKGAG